MTVDLSFTQDPEWIKSRQLAWGKIENSLSENRTKKELEARKSYFFSGIRPKIQLYPGEYMEYFPDPSFEGLKFAISSYIDEKKVEDHQYRSMQLAFSQNLEYWPGLTLDDRLRLFRLAHGGAYDPGRKFPFLIGNETKNRDFTYTADGYFTVFTVQYAICFASEDLESVFWLDENVVGHYLSMLTYVSPMMYSIELPEEKKKISIGGMYLRGVHSHLNKLMKFLIEPNLSPKHLAAPDLAASAIERIKGFLEDSSCPEILSDRWQWAKKEFAHE